MAILEILFLMSTTFTLMTANDDNICPPSNCGTFNFTYPLKLNSSQTPDECNYIDLKCNENGIATLILPQVGDFYVRSIDYDYPFIQLYDAQDCLMMKSFLSNNFTLSASPFYAIMETSYTFYSCPSYPNITDTYYPIDCLSTPTNVTVATYSLPSKNLTDLCHEIGSRVLPIDLSGDDHDLYLTWNLLDCSACEKKPSPNKTDTDNQSRQAPNNSGKHFSDHSHQMAPAVVVMAVVIIVSIMVLDYHL